MHPYLEIFGKTYPAYGSFIAMGAIMAIFAAMFFTRRKFNYDFVDYTFNIAWVFLLAMAGAKLLYLIVEIREFIADPSLFIAFIGGGGVFYGGLIGAVIGAYLSSRIRKWHFMDVMDTMAAPGALAHAFGRIGCFMSGCCYGMETDGCLGVTFPEGSLAPAGVKVLPTQLFEAIFLFVLAGVLMLIFWRTYKGGLSIGIYMTAYAVWRFIIEFFRADRRGSIGLITTSQFVSIFIFVFGLALIIFRSRLYALFEKVRVKPTPREKRKAKKAQDK